MQPQAMPTPAGAVAPVVPPPIDVNQAHAQNANPMIQNAQYDNVMSERTNNAAALIQQGESAFAAAQAGLDPLQLALNPGGAAPQTLPNNTTTATMPAATPPQQPAAVPQQAGVPAQQNPGAVPQQPQQPAAVPQQAGAPVQQPAVAPHLPTVAQPQQGGGRWVQLPDGNMTLIPDQSIQNAAGQPAAQPAGQPAGQTTQPAEIAAPPAREAVQQAYQAAQQTYGVSQLSEQVATVENTIIRLESELEAAQGNLTRWQNHLNGLPEDEIEKRNSANTSVNTALNHSMSLSNQIAAARQQHSGIQARYQDASRRARMDVVNVVNPAWGSDAGFNQAMRDAQQFYGFGAHEVEGTHDPRMFEILRDAIQHRQSMGNVGNFVAQGQQVAPQAFAAPAGPGQPPSAIPQPLNTTHGQPQFSPQGLMPPAHQMAGLDESQAANILGVALENAAGQLAA